MPSTTLVLHFAPGDDLGRYLTESLSFSVPIPSLLLHAQADSQTFVSPPTLCPPSKDNETLSPASLKLQDDFLTFLLDQGLKDLLCDHLVRSLKLPKRLSNSVLDPFRDQLKSLFDEALAVETSLSALPVRYRALYFRAYSDPKRFFSLSDVLNSISVHYCAFKSNKSHTTDTLDLPMAFSLGPALHDFENAIFDFLEAQELPMTTPTTTAAPLSISTASKNPPPSDSPSQPAATSDSSPTDDQSPSTESTKRSTKFRHWNVNVDDGTFAPSPPLNTTSRSDTTLRPNTTTSSPSTATPTLIQDDSKPTIVSDSSKTAPPSTSWPKPPLGRSFDKQQDFSTTNSDPTSTSPPNVYPPGMFAAPPGFKVEATTRHDPAYDSHERTGWHYPNPDAVLEDIQPPSTISRYDSWMHRTVTTEDLLQTSLTDNDALPRPWLAYDPERGADTPCFPTRLSRVLSGPTHLRIIKQNWHKIVNSPIAQNRFLISQSSPDLAKYGVQIKLDTASVAIPLSMRVMAFLQEFAYRLTTLGFFAPPPESLRQTHYPYGLYYEQLPDFVKANISLFSGMILNYFQSYSGLVSDKNYLSAYSDTVRNADCGFQCIYELALQAGHPALVRTPPIHSPPTQGQLSLYDYCRSYRHYAYYEFLKGIWFNERYLILQFLKGSSSSVRLELSFELQQKINLAVMCGQRLPDYMSLQALPSHLTATYPHLCRRSTSNGSRSSHRESSPPDSHERRGSTTPDHRERHVREVHFTDDSPPASHDDEVQDLVEESPVEQSPSESPAPDADLSAPDF
jgi:hypothetical protein